MNSIDSNKSRIHIQKLLYTSLVDRFDYMVDKTILDNCREDVLVKKAFQGNDEAVKESELFELLMNDDYQVALEQRLQEKLRLKVIKQRHSLKLALLLQIFNDIEDKDMNSFKTKPRVNPATGKILGTYKPKQTDSSPTGICGFADWLYSRRNGLVHGEGNKYTKGDIEQLKKHYNKDVAKTFAIKGGTVELTAVFYADVCELIKKNV